MTLEMEGGDSEDKSSLKDYSVELAINLEANCDSSSPPLEDLDTIMDANEKEFMGQRVLRSVSRNYSRDQEKENKFVPEDALLDSDDENALVIDMDCDTSLEDYKTVKESPILPPSPDKKYSLRPKAAMEIPKALLDEVAAIAEPMSDKKVTLSINGNRRKLHKSFSWKKSTKTPMKKMKLVDSVKPSVKYQASKDEPLVDLKETKVSRKKEVVNVCPRCKEQFVDVHAYTLHIREHNTDKSSHQCCICGKKLCSQSSLDRHMYTHSGERPFKCNICAVEFTTNGNMNRHKRMHEGSNDQLKPENGRGHKRLFSEVKREDANLSDNESPKKSELGVADSSISVSPPKVDSSKELDCPICAESFPNFSDFQKHLEKHSPVYPPTCEACNASFNSYLDYNIHSCVLSDSEKNSNSSAPSKKGFQDISEIDFSMRKFPFVAKVRCEENKRDPNSPMFAWECKICGKAFPCAESLSSHEMCHETGMTKCDQCGTNFTSTHEAECHKLTHKLTSVIPWENPLEGCSNAADEEKRKQIFMASLGMYKKETTTEKQRKIPRSKSIDNIPYFMHAEDPVSKTASESSNDFADIPSIISLTTMSPLTDSPVSPIATLAGSPQHTPTENILPLSVVEASAEASPDRNISVSVDGSQSGSESSSISSKEATKSNGKNQLYKCEHCPYRSPDKSTLTRHLRKHSGEHPFICKKCTCPFTTKANAHRHVKNKHKIPDKEAAAYIDYNPEMEKYNSGNNKDGKSGETVCKYCGVDFKIDRILRHHLRSASNSCKRKPFRCLLCKKGFSTKNNGIRHVNKNHHSQKKRAKMLVVLNHAISNQSVTYGTNDLNDTQDTNGQNDTQDTNDMNDTQDTNDNDTQDTNDMNDTQDTNDMNDTQDTNDLNDTQDTNLSDESNKCEGIKVEASELELEPPRKKSRTESSSETEPMRDHTEPLNLAVNDYRMQSYNGVNDRSDDEMNVAEGLISLRQGTPPLNMSNKLQDTPLDLSMSALNLSVKTERGHGFLCKWIDAQFDDERSSSPFSVGPEENNDLSIDRNCSFTEAPVSSNQFPVNLSVSSKSKSVELPSSSIPVCLVSKVIPEKNSPIPFVCFPQIIPANMLDGQHATVPLVISSAKESFTESISNNSLKKQKQKRDKAFLCDFCDKGFTLKSNKERHIKNHHPGQSRPTRSRNFLPTVSPSSIQKPSTSTLCSDRTKNALRVAIISKTNTGTIKNDIMNSGVQNSTLAPEASAENGHNTIAINSNMMNRPDVMDLASVSSVIHTANCQPFKEYLNQAKELPRSEDHSKQNNIAKSSIKGEESKRSSYASSRKSIACEYCGKTFPWLSSLSRHLLTHTGAKPHGCNLCPVRFTTKSNCDRHFKTKHPGELQEVNMRKSYKCPMCSNSYFSKSKLNKHKSLKHKIVRLKAITKFGQASTSAGLLARTSDNTVIDGEHNSSSSDASDSLECHVCHRLLGRQKDLVSHLKKVHPKECKYYLDSDPDYRESTIKEEPIDPVLLDGNHTSAHSNSSECEPSFSQFGALNEAALDNASALPPQFGMSNDAMPVDISALSRSENNLFRLLAAAHYPDPATPMVSTNTERCENGGVFSFNNSRFVGETYESTTNTLLKIKRDFQSVLV